MSHSATAMSCATKARATPAPIPPAAPVMTAVFPFRSAYMTAPRSSSVLGDETGRLDDRTPAHEVGFHLLLEVTLRRTAGRQRELGQAGDHIRLFDRRLHRSNHVGHHVRRGLSRHEE